MVQKRIYNYFERNPQLHILFIFDKMNIIQNDLEDSTWDEDLYIYKILIPSMPLKILGKKSEWYFSFRKQCIHKRKSKC